MLYTHLQHHNDTIIKTHAGITDAMIKTQEDFFNKIFTSHFIARVWKGYSRFACERELETEHNWNILTPKLWPSALCLSCSPGLLNRSPAVHSAGCWLSLLHFVHLRLQLYSPVHWLVELNCPPSVQFVGLILPSNSHAVIWTCLHASAISGDRDVSLLLSLERPVWSSSSGNNCHAVQRSLSSDASVYESIMGFFLPRPISSSNFHPRDFLS